MAKKSKIAREKQRQVIVERYAERRATLKRQLVSPDSTDDQREEARLGLQKLPATRRRSASATATRSTAARAVTSASSACRACASATWRTRASCPV